jgi:hypothetical protein
MHQPVPDQRGGIAPKTLLILAIVFGSIFSVSDYTGAYWQWYKARREALDIARFSRGVTDEEIKADLMRRLKTLGVTKYNNVTLQRDPVDQSKVRLSFDYVRPIYVPPVKYEWKKVITHRFKVSVEQGLPMVKGNM